MDNDDVISTLNDLIETCKDGEQGFRECAEDISNMSAGMASLRPFFQSRAQTCAKAATELSQEVQQLGGSPSSTGHVAGALHRGWVNVKSAITGKDDQAIVEECERGEDFAKQRYQAALAKDLPNQVRAMVERQYAGVQENHDKVKAIRDQYRTSGTASI